MKEDEKIMFFEPLSEEAYENLAQNLKSIKRIKLPTGEFLCVETSESDK